MELRKYKVCPGCGKLNPPNRLECRYCETDLTGVRVTDDSQIAQENDVAETETAIKPTLVRICDCGAQNPPQARKCSVCGEDISDILPTQVETPEKKTFIYELRCIDGSFRIEVDKPLLIIGREGELQEHLQDKRYVSRQQAKLTVVAEKVFIENLSQTNPTFVNNDPVKPNTPKELQTGDEIGLGGKCIQGKRQADAAYLLFSIRA